MRDGAQGPRTWQARHKTVPPRTQNREPEFAETQAPSQRAGGRAAAFNSDCAPRAPGSRAGSGPVPPALAETGAPNEGDPCRVGSEGRRQKAEKDEAAEELGTAVPTFPRSAHSPGSRGRRSPTGSAHARKHRPTGSSSAPRPHPPRRRPPDQSSTNPPLTCSIPRHPLALQSRNRDWLESATSPRARRVRGPDSRPTLVPGPVGMAGPSPLLRVACGRGCLAAWSQFTARDSASTRLFGSPFQLSSCPQAHRTELIRLYQSTTILNNPNFFPFSATALM